MAVLNAHARIESICYRIHPIISKLKQIKKQLEESCKVPNDIVTDGSELGDGLEHWQKVIVWVFMSSLFLSFIYGAHILYRNIMYYRSGNEHLLLYCRNTSWNHFCVWYHRMSKSSESDTQRIIYKYGTLSWKADEDYEIEQNEYLLPKFDRKELVVTPGLIDRYDLAPQDDSIDALNTLHTSLGVACVVGAFASISIYSSTILRSVTGLEWARLNVYFSIFTWTGTFIASWLVRCSIRETHQLVMIAHVTECIRLKIMKKLEGDEKSNAETTIVSGWHLIDSHDKDKGGLWYRRLGELRTARLKNFVKNLEDATKSMYNLIGTYLLVILLVCVTAWWSTQTNYGKPLTSNQESIRNSLAATSLFVWNASLTFTFSTALSSMQSWVILSGWMNDVYAQNNGEPHKDKWYVMKSVFCLSRSIKNRYGCKLAATTNGNHEVTLSGLCECCRNFLEYMFATGISKCYAASTDTTAATSNNDNADRVVTLSDFCKCCRDFFKYMFATGISKCYTANTNPVVVDSYNDDADNVTLSSFCERCRDFFKYMFATCISKCYAAITNTTAVTSDDGDADDRNTNADNEKIYVWSRT